MDQTNQEHAAEDEADELRVDEVGPHPHAVRFGFLNRPDAGRDPPVVQHRLAKRVPDEEHEEKNQPDDRHVVRLGDDQPEVGVERAEDEEGSEQPHAAVSDHVRCDELPLPERDEQRRDGQDEEPPRIREPVNRFDDETHVSS